VIALKEIYDHYTEQGYAGPVRVLSTQECQRFLQAAHDARNRPPLDWHKGQAASSRIFYEIGVHPPIIEVVTALLGEDVMLWGASMRNRPPGDVLPWHSDIESSAPSGRTVSVWIGLKHTNRDSSLLLIPYSHRFGVTVQEVRHHHGKDRRETTNDDIVCWAQERDKRSHLVNPEVTDGEALFFDGRLWHGSRNLFSETRRALLLQYATPDTVIRIPDLNNPDWPFHQLNQPRPACLMVRGSDKVSVNRVVSAPVAVSGEASLQLTSRVHPLRLPLPPDEKKGWKVYPMFRGSTANLRRLSCHVSVLTQNQIPHPPHEHKEEEILLLLAGEVDLILPDSQFREKDQRKRLKPGQFVYHPAHFTHTLQTVSEDPANYVILKWDNHDSTETDAILAFGHFHSFDPEENAEVKAGFRPRPVFEGPTACLRKLHCHASTLTPGAGYDPHIDSHDVAIIVLEGEVETLGERVGPHSVIFYPAGELHGMRNPGEKIAKYVVFEFHGRQKVLADAFSRPPSSLFAKLTDPQCWKRTLVHLYNQAARRVSVLK
jgi:mannose-6-phosphate isomerase-like protein (cupin superfamily)